MSTEASQQLSELSALIRTTGTLNITGLNKLSFSVFTENPAIARKVFVLIKSLFDIHVEITVKEIGSARKNKLYHLTVPYEDGAHRILEEAGIIFQDETGIHFIEDIPKKLFPKKAERKAYLRGAFLGCGTVVNPEKEYHMEFSLTDILFGEALAKFISSGFGIKAKAIRRKNMQIVYIKGSEQILDMLAIMGASTAHFQTNEVVIKKQLINQANRETNCEMANINKIVGAAKRQLESIEYIRSKKGWSYLSSDLREIAKLRTKYPEMPLQELGAKMKKPLGKSGVNHRLKKIDELARQLKEYEEVL